MSMFHLSPYNRVAQRVAQWHDVIVNDCTLREGEQSAQAAFSCDEKCLIATALSSAGVPRLQLSYAGGASELRSVVEAAGHAETEVLVLAFLEDWKAQIDHAVAAGVDLVNVACRSSDVLLKLLGWSRRDFVTRSVEAVGYARDRGVRVVYSPTDTTRASWSALEEAYSGSVRAGAEAVYVLDTVGVASPAAISYLVRSLASLVGSVPIGVHVHNDLGLGLANALAAYEAGARVIDTCVNGVGDRCGNPSLDEVAVALELIYGKATGVNLSALTSLANTVAELSHVAIPVNKPIVGPNAFSQKIEIHVRAILSDPLAYYPFMPELVGNRSRIVVGKHTGPVALGAKVAELGIEPLSDDDLTAILPRIAAVAERVKRPLSDHEVLELIAAVRFRSGTIGGGLS